MNENESSVDDWFSFGDFFHKISKYKVSIGVQLKFKFGVGASKLEY